MADAVEMTLEDHINNAIFRPADYEIEDAEKSLRKLPVGTILPYFPHDKVELPKGWYVAAGQKVTDPGSPFNGRNLPPLTEGRFLMGSLQEFGMTGGTNAIPSDGAHSHGTRTSTASRNGAGGDNGGDQFFMHMSHSHVIRSDGAHDHGSENRPAWFGVVYIIKIK